MADNRLKLAQGLRNLSASAREDLAGRAADIERGKTVELLRRAGKEMYDNPIVNTAIGFTPVLGDVQAAGETMAALNRGAPWQETAGYAAGMLPFVPMIGKTVWHGSPHTFEKFDLSKIGTGEGAQAYGHGLYLAESPDVAKGYKEALSNPEVVLKSGERISNPSIGTNEDVAKAWLEEQFLKGSATPFDDAIARLNKLKVAANNPQQFEGAAEILNQWKNEGATVDLGGSLYKVDLPDEQIAKMLDWDKPLSEQAPEIQNAVAPLIEAAKRSYPNMSTDLAGKHLYQLYSAHRGGNAASNQKASQALFEAGIPGIQYLDQASRGAGEGTRNYVVFSDEIPQILERNGQPVAQALRNYEAPKQATLQDVVSPIEQRGVTLDVYESNKKPLMTLSRIEVPKEMRGQGVGTQAMQDLVNYANQQGKTIALSPSTDFGGTSVNRLKDFYKQFGFVENKGRNKDFEISESMYRLPETE